jgi:hypothetical protein
VHKKTPLLLLVLAAGLGIAIAWIDSRPTWDDSGITAGLLVLTAAVFGALRPAKPWLWGLAVGVWIPLIGVGHRNPGTLLALAAALFGAYLGALLRKALGPPVKEREGH